MRQFADDTNFFCSDVTSVENALNIVNEFSKFSGLNLNLKKTKAIVALRAPIDNRQLFASEGATLSGINQ